MANTEADFAGGDMRRATGRDKVSRRRFVGNSVAVIAAATLSRPTSAATRSGKQVISDVQHIKLHGDPNTYCGHPRQCGLFNFGQGEIVVMHNHAPSLYQVRRDIQHDLCRLSQSSGCVVAALAGRRTDLARRE